MKLRHTLLNHRLRLLVLLAALLQVACDGENSNKSLVSEQDYLDYRGIEDDSSDQAQNLVAEFRERKILVNNIARTSVVDFRSVDAEIDELKDRIIIDRYFKAIVDQEVTEQKIEEYFLR